MQEAAWDVQDSLVLGKRGILVVQRRRVRESQLLSDKSQEVPSALVSQFGKPPVSDSRAGQSISSTKPSDIINHCFTSTEFPEQTSGKVRGLREGV